MRFRIAMLSGFLTSILWGLRTRAPTRQDVLHVYCSWFDTSLADSSSRNRWLGIDSSGIEFSEIDLSGMEFSGLDLIGLEVSGLEFSGLECRDSI